MNMRTSSCKIDDVFCHLRNFLRSQPMEKTMEVKILLCQTFSVKSDSKCKKAGHSPSSDNLPFVCLQYPPQNAQERRLAAPIRPIYSYPFPRHYCHRDII